MKIPMSMLDKVSVAVQKGQFDEIQRVDMGATPPKETKRLKKLVAACDSDCWMTKFTKSSGFAHWTGVFRISDREHEYRYGLLVLDRFDRRALYAVPVQMAERLEELPECPLHGDDLQKILAIAGKISEEWTVAAETDRFRRLAEWNAVVSDFNDRQCGNRTAWQGIG